MDSCQEAQVNLSERNPDARLDSGATAGLYTFGLQSHSNAGFQRSNPPQFVHVRIDGGFCAVREPYAEVERRVRDLVETHVPLVGAAVKRDCAAFRSRIRRYTDFEMALYQLQTAIWQSTGVHVTIAAAKTNCVAAIAARTGRPRGIHIVPPGRESKFLNPLPLTVLRGLGEPHAGSLRASGIATLGELRRIPRRALGAAFGEEAGRRLWQLARGMDATQPKIEPLRPKPNRHKLLQQWMAGTAMRWRRVEQYR